MITPTIALALALAPDTSPPRYNFDVADAEVVTGDRSTHLLAFDADGEVSAEIVVWIDVDDQPRLDITFADGLYLRVTGDGRAESPDAVEVAARALLITDWLSTAQVQEGWGGCLTSAAAAVGSCAGGLIACPFAAAFAACDCIPVLFDEFEEMSCPYW